MIDESDAGEQRIEFDATRAAGYDDEVSEYAIYDEIALFPFLDRFAGKGSQFTVLDLGCGTGAVTVHLVRRGFTVQAVDISPDMIAVAKSKVERENGGDHVTFQVSEAGNLRFPDCTFDLVTSQRVLHHIPDIRPVFAEVERVLKPGGSFFLSDVVADATPAARALRSVWRTLLRFEKSNRGERPHTRACTDGNGRELHRSATEFVRLLASGGFSYQLRFFTHVGLQRYLSTKQRTIAINVLSAPWKNRGDVLFVHATKSI